MSRPLLTTRDSPVRIANVPCWRKDDPIFWSELTTNKDEVEFRRVMADPVCFASFRALVMGMISRGWELRPASESPAAKAAQEMGLAVVRGLIGPAPGADQGTGLMPLLWDAPRALTEGWMVFQREWRPSHIRTSDGRRWWSIARVVSQPQEYFFASLDGQLVFRGGGWAETGGQNKAQVLDQQSWSTLAIGSARSPYGSALAGRLWPSWYVKSLHSQFREQGARGAIHGTPVIKRTGNVLMSSLAGSDASSLGDVNDHELEMALRQAQTAFDNFGWLLLPPGWELEKMAQPGATDAWSRLVDYHDMRLKLIIEGQHLAAEQAATGSYAASQTQNETKLTYVQSLASQVGEWLSALVGSVLRYNLVLDPDDAPSWHFGIQDTLDSEKLRAFVELGGIADGLAVAKRPDWLIPIPAEVTEMPLSRRETADPGLMPVAPAPAPAPEFRASRLSALGQTWEELTKIEDRLSDEQLAEARDEYGAYMERLEVEVLKATRGGGDLDPKV